MLAPARVLATRTFTASRLAAVAQRRAASSQAPIEPQPPPVNRHRQFYKTQGYPVTKAVLIAITTYELLYWGWLALESYETKADAHGELGRMRQEVKDLVKGAAGSG